LPISGPDAPAGAEHHASSIAIYSSEVGVSVWALLAVIGFRSSSNAPTGLGLIACSLIVVSGLILGIVENSWWHVAGGVLPGVTWFGACAVQGTAMTCIEEKLRASAEYFARLERSGNLVRSIP
jgi:hypothetical protein